MKDSTLTFDYVMKSSIFPDTPMATYALPFIEACDMKKYGAHISRWNNQTCRMENTYFPTYSRDNIQKYLKYAFRTPGNMYVKMLMRMENEPCSYREIYNSILKPLGKPMGNDTLSFISMQKRGLMEFDHYGKYRRKFYRITKLGKLIVEAAKTNMVVYRVLRHFMKFEGDFIEYSINVSLNPETMNDLTPASMVKLLDALFNESSDIHKLGSHIYWSTKLLDALKKNKDCYSLMESDEVKKYLSDNASNPYVAKFNEVLARIVKRYTKNKTAQV